MNGYNFTERVRRVLSGAREQAFALRHEYHAYVGTEHLLLGLMREERNIAAQSLAATGLTVQRVRDEVLRLLGTEGPKQRAATKPRFHDDMDEETAITLVIEHPDGRVEARKFRRTGDAVSFLNGLER